MVARIALSFALVTVLAGTAQAQTSRLLGQVSYPDRVQLGKTAVLELTLEDVSDATSAGVVIATMRMPKPGQTPVIFSMDYDAVRVKPAGRYVLRARIVDSGATMLESATPVRVLTQGTGSIASVTLVQVEPKPIAPSPAAAPKALAAQASAKAVTPSPKATPEPKATPAPKPLPEPKTATTPKPEPKATPTPKATPAPKPLPEPKTPAAPKPLPADLSAVTRAKAEASAKAGKPEPKSTPTPKATPAPKPLPEPKSTPAPKPLPEPKTAAAPKPLPADLSAVARAKAEAPAKAGAPFGTAWTIVEINGKPVGQADKDHRKIVLAFDDIRQTYSGISGCTDLAGGFARNGAKLTPTSDQSSQICRVDEGTQRAMRSVMQDTRGYRVSDTTLELLDAKGACLARLER